MLNMIKSGLCSIYYLLCKLGIKLHNNLCIAIINILFSKKRCYHDQYLLIPGGGMQGWYKVPSVDQQTNCTTRA